MQRIVAGHGKKLAFAALLFFLVVGSAKADDLLAVLKVPRPAMLCGEAVPVNDWQTSERFEKEMLLIADDRPQLILWLKRSTRYFPYIEKLLRRRDFPDDLKYLAVAESSLRMHAGSVKGAMGVWQLMPQTAMKYGLQVDEKIDERRNIYLSTPAALTYLYDLYERFGSWSLSLAAYNMGEVRLEAEILEQGTNDYYRLYLPLETQRFIFRIMAIKILFQAPESVGIHLAGEDCYPPETFSSVRITDADDLPLRLIARAARTDFKSIKDLNPELRGYYLTAGDRQVNVPLRGDVGFADRLARLVEADAREKNQRLYVVKQGDNLSEIADQFDVPITALLIWNRIGIHHLIHPGQRLIVYRPTATPDAGPVEKSKEGDR